MKYFVWTIECFAMLGTIVLAAYVSSHFFGGRGESLAYYLTMLAIGLPALALIKFCADRLEAKLKIK